MLQVRFVIPKFYGLESTYCIYETGSGRGSAAWMYSGMAIRMAQELKLNHEIDDIQNDPVSSFALSSLSRNKMQDAQSDSKKVGLSWIEREQRRRIWWSCFAIDRYFGAAADRSMIINEKGIYIYIYIFTKKIVLIQK